MEKKKEQQNTNHMIAKRNDLIQQSRQSLGLVENKILSYILTKVKPEDQPGKVYKIYYSDLKENIGWNKSESYNKLRATLKRLSDQSWWWDLGDGKYTLIRWFEDIVIETKNESFDVVFHKRMIPFILDLKHQQQENGFYFTTYQHECIKPMKHRYSPRIYELLKSYSFNNKTWDFELGTGTAHDLMYRICDVDENGKPLVPNIWLKDFGQFRVKVLEPAKKEINLHTDLQIDYTLGKIDLGGTKRSRFCRISFIMNKNPNFNFEEDKEYIDVNYTVVDSQCKQNAPLETDDDFNLEIYHPFLFTTFSDDFTQEELNGLIQVSYQKMPLNILDTHDEKETWLYCYINHYHGKIMITKKETKSTIYNRILDMLTKDYDNISIQIAWNIREGIEPVIC